MTPESEGWTEGHQENSEPDFYGKWFDVDRELPEVDFNQAWRTAKAFPVYTESVGVTYAYFTRKGWVESHIYGEDHGDMAYTGGVHETMSDITHWMNIPSDPEL